MARYNSRVAKGLGFKGHRKSRPCRWFSQKRPRIPKTFEEFKSELNNESVLSEQEKEVLRIKNKPESERTICEKMILSYSDLPSEINESICGEGSIRKSNSEMLEEGHIEWVVYEEICHD